MEPLLKFFLDGVVTLVYKRITVPILPNCGHFKITAKADDKSSLRGDFF
jgi:hypothetical protein